MFICRFTYVFDEILDEEISAMEVVKAMKEKKAVGVSLELEWNFFCILSLLSFALFLDDLDEHLGDKNLLGDPWIRNLCKLDTAICE